MKKLISLGVTLLLLLFTQKEVKAQRSHALYVEGLGNGLLYSLNYDVRFAERTDKWGARIGVAPYREVFTSLVQINYLFGTGKHRFEVGGGATTQLGFAGEKGRADIAPNAALMYRYQNPSGNFLFRVGLGSIFIGSDEGSTFEDLNKIFWFWPGLSLGYHF
ncbi:MAG: hypothetical protein AB8F74_04330 [Saprospiraceae bacterium]